MNITDFKEEINGYYLREGRSFPWRSTFDPYRIVVSEIMLQQTPTNRVLPKYLRFIEKYPDFPALAGAVLADLLPLWQGLGYNRRAVALREIASRIMKEYGGTLPQDPGILRAFPMIGPATSCSIVTFAYNIPTVFIEVNIRRVFLHFFFPGERNVHDREILPLVEDTLDTVDPRRWYYALMDYGVMLKKINPSLHTASIHYTKQKPFAGSNRQIRGSILRFAADRNSFSREDLYEAFDFERENVEYAAEQLIKEGFLDSDGTNYILRK